MRIRQTCDPDASTSRPAATKVVTEAPHMHLPSILPPQVAQQIRNAQQKAALSGNLSFHPQALLSVPPNHCALLAPKAWASFILGSMLCAGDSADHALFHFLFMSFSAVCEHLHLHRELEPSWTARYYHSLVLV